MPGVQNPMEVRVAPPQLNEDEVKADKVQKLAVCMRKSHRVKPFKFDQDVLFFLKRYSEELTSLKSICAIDFDLRKDQYIPIFKASLDFAVLERLDQRFKDALKIG